MAKRKALSKKIRFEVFKRDKFTCQYCGGKAPDVLLHVDHIISVVDGGNNELLNLVASCGPCNLGKGARALDDESAVLKARKQLEDLQEREEQVKLLIRWTKELGEQRERLVDTLVEHWEHLAPGWEVNDHGRRCIGAWVRRFGFHIVLDSMDVAAETYLRFDEHGVVSETSWIFTFDKIPGVAYNTKRRREEANE